MVEKVHPQVTDGITQASSHVLGLGPASAAINGYLGQTQALSVLFANMVNQQQNQATLDLSATTRNVAKLLAAKPSQNKTVNVRTTTSRMTMETAAPQGPVVT